MADRTVSVKLVLDAAAYKRGIEEAAVATDHLDNRVEAVDKDLKKLPKDGAEAAAAMKAVGTEAESTGRKLKDVDKAGSNLTRKGGWLSNLKKDFESDFSNVTKAFGNGGIGGFLKVGFLTPQGLAVTIPAAVVLGQMLGGAIVTGIGLAGIGAGIALQFHDPQVQAAVGQFKSDLTIGLKSASASFAEPLSKAVGILDQGFKSALPGIQDTFAKLAPSVTVLAHGASGFLTNVTTGLEHVAVASVPLQRDFASWLPKFGNNLQDIFDAMAAHSKEAERGLHELEDTISGLTEFGAKSIPVLSAVGNALSYINGVGLAGHIGNLFGIPDSATHGPGIGDLATKTVDAFTKGAAAADNMAAAVKRLGTDLTGLLNNTLSVNQANDKFKQDLLNLKDGVDLHGKSLKDNTQAGLENRQVIEGYIADAQRARDAAIQHAGGVNASKSAIDAANSTYDQAIRDIVTMGEKAHLSKQDLEQLAGNYYVNVIEAIQAINASGLQQNVAPHDPNRKGNHRALGGWMFPGQRYTVGENGMEVVSPAVPSWVTPNNQLNFRSAPPSFRATSAAAPPAVTVVISPKDGALGALVDLIDVQIEHSNTRTAAAVAGGPRP